MVVRLEDDFAWMKMIKRDKGVWKGIICWINPVEQVKGACFSDQVDGGQDRSTVGPFTVRGGKAGSQQSGQWMCNSSLCSRPSLFRDDNPRYLQKAQGCLSPGQSPASRQEHTAPGVLNSTLQNGHKALSPHGLALCNMTYFSFCQEESLLLHPQVYSAPLCNAVGML